jgi:general secretion pathway protein M
MAALAQRWNARSPRERRAIALGAAVVTVALLWAYLWVPLQTDRARLLQELPRLRVAAGAVAEGAQEAPRLRAAVQRATAGSAAGVIEARAREDFAAAFGAVAALGDDRYRVTLQPVAFEALTRYLGALATEHGIVVDSLALAPQAGPGTVAVEALVLRAPRNP